MAVAPIHIAARTRDIETLRRLLEEGVSPDLLGGSFARTPLLYMCDNTDAADPVRVACFKLLRDAGANLGAASGGGITALHYAAAHGDVEIVSLLVESGVNVNAVISVGSTPLHFAAMRNVVDCAEVLLAAGADIDARAEDGRRPFDNTLSHGCRRAWPLFLRAGAEIPTDNTDPYIVRVRNAGGFKKYEQAHITRITAILAQTPRLPPEMARKIVEFWLHAGYY